MKPFRSNQRQRPSRGYTLLELILALALTALIMVAIGMALDLHLRTLQSRRNYVEETQLARSVLRLIADDLRGAVQFQTTDFSGVPSLPSISLDDLEGLAGDVDRTPNGQPASGSGGPSGSSQDFPLEEDSEESESQAIASSVAPPTRPGIYGNQLELQVDVSRLPRLDEYDPSLSSGFTGGDIPSDVKTIAYFLQVAQLDSESELDVSNATAEGELADTGTSGLIRRELDRAVTQWAASNGGVDDTAAGGVLIAPEVQSLTFEYYDGSGWLTEWDSDEAGGLPVAVRIEIGIVPQYSRPTSESDEAEMVEELSYHSLTVYLPASEIAEPSEGGDLEDADMELSEEPL